MVAYIDTGAWIALLDAKDTHHEAARAMRSSIQDAQEILFTGWHTLIELADGLTRHASQAHSAETIQAIVESQSVHVEPSQPHRDRALEFFTKYHDWNVDLSDCFSFALMEEHGIQRAFTYDDDFAKPGFEIIG